MMTIREIRSACGILGAVLLSATPGASGEAGPDDQVDGAASKIVWGEHWGGPEVRAAGSLEGKVVLLTMWGGCPACRGVTPGMLALAKKYKDEPFHVIASYCQTGEKDQTLEYLKGEGWSDEMRNLSVMYQTHYAPDVAIAQQPYYLLFDHSGKLRYHHLAGVEQGGNGDLYQRQVAELLKEASGPNDPVPVALTDLRSWANIHGRQIEASLLGVSDGRAKFQGRNGRTYEYPLEKLTEHARKEIAELLVR
jgi:thiol-disulfide isomerase/thioredoxin